MGKIKLYKDVMGMSPPRASQSIEPLSQTHKHVKTQAQCRYCVCPLRAFRLSSCHADSNSVEAALQALSPRRQFSTFQRRGTISKLISTNLHAILLRSVLVLAYFGVHGWP